MRDMLRESTGLKFERVPASGALEYLKGDLYVPNQRNHFCIEVKNYKESALTDKIFTQPKTNNLFLNCYVLLAEEWLESEKVEWIGGF